MTTYFTYISGAGLPLFYQNVARFFEKMIRKLKTFTKYDLQLTYMQKQKHAKYRKRTLGKKLKFRNRKQLFCRQFTRITLPACTIDSFGKQRREMMLFLWNGWCVYRDIPTYCIHEEKNRENAPR